MGRVNKSIVLDRINNFKDKDIKFFLNKLNSKKIKIDFYWKIGRTERDIKSTRPRKNA